MVNHNMDAAHRREILEPVTTAEKINQLWTLDPNVAATNNLMPGILMRIPTMSGP